MIMCLRKFCQNPKRKYNKFKTEKTSLLKILIYKIFRFQIQNITFKSFIMDKKKIE